jgi:hypothetical protein
MPKVLDGCTCWVAPATNGKGNPSTWLTMHPEVEIRAADGRCIRGWPLGVEADNEHRLAEWIVDDGRGNLVGIPLGDVTAVDPIPADPNDFDSIRQLLQAIANPFDVPTHGLDLRFLVGLHESIEVSVQLRRWPCEP